MKKWFKRVGLTVLVIAILMATYAVYQLRSRGFMRLPSYDSVAPVVPDMKRPAVLVFSKTNAFIHKEAIPAAEAMLKMLADNNGWSIYITENGAIHNPEDLARFDTIIWNNVTGDVLTEQQQQAMKSYIEAGGGWIGIHGAGDGSSKWDWYNETLIGANFIGHPMDPQFQTATMHIEAIDDFIVNHLGREWIRSDEWYSFAESPRKEGKQILATLDESTYSPRFFDEDIRMGEDHPIIWKHCPGQGRAFYSALGHTAESYAEPKYIALLENAIIWTAGLSGEQCELTQAPEKSQGEK